MKFAIQLTASLTGYCWFCPIWFGILDVKCRADASFKLFVGKLLPMYISKFTFWLTNWGCCDLFNEYNREKLIISKVFSRHTFLVVDSLN